MQGHIFICAPICTHTYIQRHTDIHAYAPSTHSSTNMNTQDTLTHTHMNTMYRHVCACLYSLAYMHRHIPNTDMLTQTCCTHKHIYTHLPGQSLKGGICLFMPCFRHWASKLELISIFSPQWLGKSFPTTSPSHLRAQSQIFPFQRKIIVSKPGSISIFFTGDLALHVFQWNAGQLHKVLRTFPSGRL